MLENINKAVTAYNEMVYRSRPVKVSEFLSDKYNIVHRKLYEYSLTSYLKEYIDKICIKNHKCMYYLYNYCINNEEKDNISKELEKININNDETLFKIKEYILKEVFILLVICINDIIYKLDQEKINEIIDKVNKIEINENCKTIQDVKTILLNNVNNYLKTIIESIDIEFEYNEDLNEYDNEFDKPNILEINKIKIIFSQDTNIYLCINNEIVKNNYSESLSELNNYLYKYNKKLKTSILNIIIYYYRKSHKFIEIKNDEYWKPSSVIIIGAIYPYNKKKISLNKYWNNYQNKERFKLDLLKITNEENIKDSQIEEIDYINGKVKVYSKSTDITYDVDFDYIDEDTNINNDILLENTFTYKYNKIKK